MKQLKHWSFNAEKKKVTLRQIDRITKHNNKVALQLALIASIKKEAKK